MIGLEYILEVYGMQQAELAEHLGIRPQNITLWLRGKQNVSKKHLPILSEMFNMPAEYFQKELTEIDKREIDLMHAERELNDGYSLDAMFDYCMKSAALRETKLLCEIKEVINTVPKVNSIDEYNNLYDKNIGVFNRFTNSVKNDINLDTVPCILSGIEKYENKENADELLSVAENSISDALLEELSLSDALAAVILLYEKKGIKNRVWGEKKPENLGN